MARFRYDRRMKMACKICGRQACTECFHSIEAQEQHEKEQNIIEEARLMTEPEQENENG